MRRTDPGLFWTIVVVGVVVLLTLSDRVHRGRRMSEPEGVSLGELGLVAPRGLSCPLGGLHHVLWLTCRSRRGISGGSPVCQKCREPVLRWSRPLELEE